MFDPSKYGAVRVDETPPTPTGKFDPNKYGATLVQEETLTPAQTVKQEDRGILEKASDITDATLGKASSLFSGTGKFAGGALLNVTNLIASKMKPVKEMTESDRALTEIDTKAVQKAHELALKGDKEGANRLLKVVQSHGTNITLKDILPDSKQNTAGQIVGAGAQTFLEQASFAKGTGLPGVSKITQPVTSAISKVTQPIKSAIPKTFGAVKGATQAGGYAGLFGASEGLQQEGATVSSVAGSALDYATNPLVLATGGALGTLAGRMSPEASKLRTTNALREVEDEISKIERSYAKTRPLIDKNAPARKLVAESDALIGAVDDTGTISTKIKGGAIDKFKSQTIDGLEGIVKKGLEQEGIAISPGIIREQMRKSILKSKLEGEALKKALNKIGDEIEGLMERATPEGNIPLSKLQDSKIFTTGNIDYTKPTSKIEAKAYANAYKTLIENNSKLNIKEVNGELAKYYEALDLLETLDGKKVKGGKLGKYAARIGGQLAGSAIGGAVGGLPGMAVGTIAGGETAAKIQGMLMSKTFGKGVGTGIKQSAILREAGQKYPNSRLLLPQKASVKETTINLPAKLPRTQGQVKSPSDLRTSLPIKPTKKTTLPQQNPLIQEAKKYKSAEEFVKAQGTPVYHGTDVSSAGSISKDGFKIMSAGNAESGISLSTNKNISGIFSGKDGRILDVVISPDTKLMAGDEFDAILGKLVREKKMPYKTKQEQAIVDSLAAREAKKLGYDGVDWRGQSEGIESLSDEIRVWNTNKIKTKSQLTDIWNKANKTSSPRKNLPKKLK